MTGMCRQLFARAILPAVVFATALTGCRCNSEHSTVPTRIYTVKDMGITFPYPLNWEETVRNRQNILAPENSIDNPLAPKLVIEIIRGSETIDNTPRTLAQLVEETQKKLQQKNRGLKILYNEEAPLKHLNQNTAHLLVQFSIAGKKFNEELIFIPHNDNFLAIYYLVPTDDYEQLKDVFYQILLNLSLTEPIQNTDAAK